MMDKATQAAVREINRKLQSRLRTDWQFPSHALPTPAIEDPDISRSEDGAESRVEASPAVQTKKFRERYYASTDDEDGLPYQYDNPDSVGPELEKKSSERKKRKREAMEDELKNNPGLCFFMRRRNAWTGAVTRTEHGNGDHMEGVEGAEVEEKVKLTTKSASSPADSAVSANSEPAAIPAAAPEDGTLEPTTGSGQPPSASQPLLPEFQPPEDPSTLTDVLIPVAPPLIPPTNPVRVTISARSHSELYTKVVRDNRTPAVPINLADMTQIIVQGWKDEGNWPPRGNAPEAAIAGKKPLANRIHSVIGHRHNHEHDSEGFLGHHPHIKSGVESVKKVFRLSSGSHDEGRRKSSAGQGDPESAFRSHD